MGNVPPAVILVVGALLLPAIPRRARPAAFVALPALVAAVLLALPSGTALAIPFLDYELVPLRVDRLSLAFAIVFTLITFLGGVYSFQIEDTAQRVAILLYAGSALGVVFAGDLLTLFVFWELMALSSAYLVLARRTPQARRAGVRYLFVHLFGGSVLLAGILLHVAETGSLAFDRLEGGVAAYLILFAFALNAAVPLLHAWLTDAYPEGTVTGAVFLSAFTTKTAVYALARGFAGWDILVWAGVAMALYGVIYAVLENDIRRLLAYHIISQVGYMVAGVGLGTEAAINGATAHAFAHILYKGLLFMGAGTVLHATGRSRLTELGGLIRAMPLTFLLYMVGAFSISGFPLFSGFVSKSLVVHAAELNHLQLVVLLLNLASVGTFLSIGLKLPYFTWFGRKRSLAVVPTPRGMHLGMALTAAVSVAIGVYPALLYNLMPFPVDYQPYTTSHVVQTLQLLLFTGLGFWLLLDKLGGSATISLDADWFYRRPARLARRVAVDAVSHAFASAETVLLRTVWLLTDLSADPVGYLMLGAAVARDRKWGDGYSKLRLGPYDPDRYRPPLGVVVLVVLLCFIIAAWIFFG